MKNNEKIKMYIEIPLLQATWNKSVKKSLLFGFGLSRYGTDFKTWNKSGIYPKGEKKGKHIFTLSVHMGSFSMKIVFYKPKDKLSWETKTDKKNK